jgi:transposase
MNAITEPNPTELHATIKLGIDAHAKWFYVARQQIVRERQRLQSMGRSLLPSHGIHVNAKRWTGETWRLIGEEAPAWVIERLNVLVRLIEPIEAEEKAMTEAIQEKGAGTQIPRGVGPLTFELLRRKVGDWSRFTNPQGIRAEGAEARWTERRGARRVSERAERGHQHSSGGKRRGGSVRKKAVVAIARQLAVDLWRLFTGQTTADKLGLIYLPEAA